MGIPVRIAAVLLVALVVAPPVAARGESLAPTCTKTGTAGRDTMSGTSGPDVLCGLGGNDLLKGLAGNDVLIGGPGNDRLVGGDGDDSLQGDAGNDTLSGVAGSDVLAGGADWDLVSYGGNPGFVIVTIGGGADDGLTDGAVSENDDVRADVERVWGTSGPDKISTLAVAPVQLRGMGSDDFLTGGPGADVIDGGGGDDVLRGRRGPDTLKCGTGADGYSDDGTDDIAGNCEHENPISTPVPVGESFTTPEDTALEVSAATLIANDTDLDDDPLSFAGVHNGRYGSVSSVDGVITFVPDANFAGDWARFYYTVTDGEASADGQVSVFVEQVNDAPVAFDDQASVKQDSSVTISVADLLANDTDIDSVKQLSAVQNPLNGAVQVTPASSPPGKAVVFTPSAGYCGTAGFDYTLSDGSLTDVGHVSITVTCTPPPPPPPHIVAATDTVYGVEDTELLVPVSDLVANDVDADGHLLSIVEVQSGMGGNAQLQGDQVRFLPDPDDCNVYPGASHYPAWFGYRVTDGTADDIGIVEVWLECVNDPPITWFQFAHAERDTPLVLESSDFEGFDMEFDVLTVVAVSNAVHGSVSVSDGVVTFVPEPGFCGDAGFDFTLSDGEYEATDHMYLDIWSQGCSS